VNGKQNKSKPKKWLSDIHHCNKILEESKIAVATAGKDSLIHFLLAKNLLPNE
jgi:hypothetical protein